MWVNEVTTNSWRHGTTPLLPPSYENFARLDGGSFMAVLSFTYLCFQVSWALVFLTLSPRLRKLGTINLASFTFIFFVKMLRICFYKVEKTFIFALWVTGSSELDIQVLVLTPKVSSLTQLIKSYYTIGSELFDISQYDTKVSFNTIIT